MKKSSILLCACVICGSVIFTGYSDSNQVNADEAAETETTETEVTQTDIEENLIGSWIMAERDGKPALTNDKAVYNFVSPTKAYISASFNAHPESGSPWVDLIEADVAITGNKAVFSWQANEDMIIVDEVSISSINEIEQQGSLIVKSIVDDKETIVLEEQIRLEKINDDYSNDIIGTWEGRCTSDRSEFDDGQEHRWEYKDDGTYVYYVKDGDNWVPSDDDGNEYFVAGNLLCGRWFEDGTEYREWWEVSVYEDTMNWTALREDADGKTYTSTFEMKKVQE